QRRERNHGRGIPDMCMRPIARSTPVFQTGKAPDGHTDMREPANKSLLTDVSRLCSYRCTIIVPTTSLAFAEGTGCGAQSTLTWGIRVDDPDRTLAGAGGCVRASYNPAVARGASHPLTSF